MAHVSPATWLLDAFAPLADSFGDRLAVARDGGQVAWSCDGRSALVEPRPDGTIAARFLDRPMPAVLGTGRAVYATDDYGYPMTAVGCERMVSDMLAFFSGAPDPRFRFIAVT